MAAMWGSSLWMSKRKSKSNSGQYNTVSVRKISFFSVPSAPVFRGFRQSLLSIRTSPFSHVGRLGCAGFRRRRLVVGSGLRFDVAEEELQFRITDRYIRHGQVVVFLQESSGQRIFFV